MYVINGESFGKDRIYECNRIVADWLTYKMKIPLFSSNPKTKRFYFMKTEALNKALDEMPIYLNIAKIF